MVITGRLVSVDALARLESLVLQEFLVQRRIQVPLDRQVQLE